MILSIVNKAVSNFFHFSAENSYLFGIHKIIALAGLIDFPFKYRDRVDINTDANNLTGSGFYAVYCWGEDIASKHYPIELGHIIVFQDGAGGSVSQLAISDNGTSYTRMRWGLDSWSAWRQLS